MCLRQAVKSYLYNYTFFIIESESTPSKERASSELKPFSEIFHHNLVEISGAFSTVGLSQEAFTVQSLRVNEKKQYSFLVHRDKPLSGDFRLGKFVCECLKRAHSTANVWVYVDKEIEVMKKIHSFGCSSTFRPDTCVCLDIDGYTLPIVDMEVQSSPFENSVCKNVANVIALLRLLRHVNLDICELSGFTFPSEGSKERPNSPRCAVKSTVSWKMFRFVVVFADIEMESVSSEITAEFKRIQSKLNTCSVPEHFVYFCPLSEEDMQNFHKSAVQVESRFSIIVQSPLENKIYKYSPYLTLIFDLFQRTIEEDPASSSHFLLSAPKRKRVYNTTFLVFDLLNEPLSASEACTCLAELVEEIAAALQQLHGYGYAHLDVRLPNICFRDSKPVLIDFDRVCMTGTSASLENKYHGQMYKAETGWLIEQLDWKQLGIMIVQILDKIDPAEYHNIRLPEKGKTTLNLDENQFIKTLIEEGMLKLF